MLTRSQLITLTAMSTLGGSFAGLLVVGMIAGDLTLAWINLGLIIAVFSSVFVLSCENPKKQKRAGDLHVGGEVLPEFAQAFKELSDAGCDFKREFEKTAGINTDKILSAANNAAKKIGFM